MIAHVLAGRHWKTLLTRLRSMKAQKKNGMM